MKLPSTASQRLKRLVAGKQEFGALAWLLAQEPVVTVPFGAVKGAAIGAENR